MRRFALLAALLGAAFPVLADPGVKELSNLKWGLDERWFGGFSGIEMTADGGSATLITDRGSLVRIRLIRQDGIMRDIEVESRVLLRNRNGTPLKGSARDAEGLAIHPGGTAHISYEFRDHTARLDLQRGTSKRLSTHPDFDHFPHNRGLEALAIHPDGTLYALSENAADTSGTIPLYAYRSGRWHISHRIPLSGGHVPVGADFDTEGRLYVLERILTPLGFSSRIRRLDLVPAPGRATVLLTTMPGTYDNLEGVSVWRDNAGNTRLTLVSDNNFLPLFKSQIVEFIVTE